MKIIIFAGTTEGNHLSYALAQAGADVTVSVASEYGAEEQMKTPGLSIEEGPKTVEEMRLLLKGAELCVDATHPYAVLVSENIRAATVAENVELLRLKRTAIPLENCDEDLLIADSPEEAARLAAEIGGNVFLTTGSKDLQIYAKAMDPAHLFPRVLPLITSIEACEKAEIPHKNIIALQGPFSTDFNCAVIKEYHIDVLITKESGKAGGFTDKIQAAKSCGIPAIVVARPADEGLSYDEVLSFCMKKINGEG